MAKKPDTSFHFGANRKAKVRMHAKGLHAVRVHGQKSGRKGGGFQASLGK
jgi:hypothetical protein